jgi:Amt family ammonium transporter
VGVTSEQFQGNGATIVYSFAVTTLIMLAMKAKIGVRVVEEVEDSGLDLAEHAETAYSSGSATLAGH